MRSFLAALALCLTFGLSGCDTPVETKKVDVPPPGPATTPEKPPEPKMEPKMEPKAEAPPTTPAPTPEPPK